MYDVVWLQCYTHSVAIRWISTAFMSFCRRHVANLWAIACSPGKLVQRWRIVISQSKTSSFESYVCFVLSKVNKKTWMNHKCNPWVWIFWSRNKNRSTSLFTYVFEVGQMLQKSRVKLQNTCAGPYPFQIKIQEHNQHKNWGSSCSARWSFISRIYPKGKDI